MNGAGTRFEGDVIADIGDEDGPVQARHVHDQAVAMRRLVAGFGAALR